MNSGSTDTGNTGIVNLRMDMLDIEDVIVLMWGAMALDDGQVSIAWGMAEDLAKVGGESSMISEDKFFEIIEPTMKKIAAIDYHLSDLGMNRVLAVLYSGLITQMAEDLGNDKKELLAAAKERYPGFEWEFHPPWECPKQGQEQK